jgi:PAS domain S-box-containing protein
LDDGAEVHLHPQLHRQAAKERRILRLANELAATLGADYFQSVVRHLARTLEADCVYIGELASLPVERFHTVAVFRAGETAENFQQDLAGTASASVLSDGAFACGKDAARRFPLDKVLEEMRAEGFVGLRLSDESGQAIGLLALISCEPLTDVGLVKSVLEVFAPRAAGELERKLAGAGHRENEERYRAFIASNPDAMWRMEFVHPIPLSLPEEEQIERFYRDGYVAECNDAMVRLMGSASAEQFVGKPFAEIVPRTDTRVLEEVRNAVRARFEASSNETTLLDDKGQRIHRLRTQFGIIENGELRRIWVTTRDISTLRLTELALAASEERFRDVLEGIQLPAVMLDSSGEVTFCNDCFTRLAQRPSDDLRRRNCLKGIVSDLECETWRAALVPETPDKPGTSHFEGAIIPAEGPRHIIAWDIVRLRNKDKKPAGLAAIGRDITQQLRLEAEIRQSQTLDSIGRFASGVAHDFNNLLTVILVNAGHLLPQIQKSSGQANLSAIEKAAMQCGALTAQLLAIGRKQRLQADLISLNDVIGGAESTFRGILGQSVEMALRLAPAIERVYADASQIQRALINLVTNARDAMQHGGRLTIATSNVAVAERDETYPPAVKPGSYVRVAVTDTGVGLSEEVRAHIFEPFFTTKSPDKGHGLGLSIVYGIVTQSGGHLIVHSEPQKGATFEILLPVVARA